MGASTGIFRESEVAVMVTVVLLTTLITPLLMRGAFMIKSPYDDDEQIGNAGASDEFSNVAEFQAEI